MCNCHSNMDIRGRCDPILHPVDYKKCGARVDTGYFHLTNDYETYTKLEKCKTKKQKEKVIVSYLHKKLKIISRSEKDKIIEYFWEQDEERKKQEEEDEKENEIKLMVELKALLDNRYIIKQKSYYGNWTNNITIIAEFNCNIHYKKSKGQSEGWWPCRKCHCKYGCGMGTSKEFDDLIAKYGYRHDVIDCSCVSALWKIKK